MEDYRHIYQQFEAKRGTLTLEAELERQRPRLKLCASLAHFFRHMANRLEPRLPALEVPELANTVADTNAASKTFSGGGRI